MRSILIFLIVFSFCPIVLSQNLSTLSYAELDSLMTVEYSKGNFKNAIPYMEVGREKAKLEFGEMDSIYAEYTSNLAILFNQTGDYLTAETLYLQAKNIRSSIFGEQHLDYISSVNNLAALYYLQGRYEQAETYYLQTKAGRSKILGQEHPDYAAVLNSLAMLYQAMGNYEKSEAFYLQTLSILTKILGEQHPYYATTLNNLAILYQAMGNYNQAETFYLQAININAKTHGEQHPTYAKNLNNLASLYQAMDKYEQAKSLLLQSKDICSNTLGEAHPEFALRLNNLGMVYRDMGNYDQAEKLFLQAQNIQVKAQGEFHPTYAINLNNLALLYQDIGDYEKSEKLYLQAKNIKVLIYGKEHPSVSSSFNNLAHLYSKMDSLNTALQFCYQGIDALSLDIDSSFTDVNLRFQDWGNAEHHVTNLDKYHYSSNESINKSIETLLDILYKQFKKTGDKNKLQLHYQVAQAAMRLNERIRNDFSNESDKLRSLTTSSAYVQQGIKSGIELSKSGYQEETFSFAEMNKGVLLMDAIKASTAHKFGNLPDSLAAEERLLQKKQASLEAKLLEKRSKEQMDSLLSLLTKTKKDISYFNANLKTNHPQYNALKYKSTSVGVKEIQSLLVDGTALLEYVIADSVVYIFYVDKNTIELVPIFIKSSLLASKINLFHSILSNYQFAIKEDAISYQKYTENAFWFYENLLFPVLKNKKNIHKLILVTDGELGHLPFEAFLVKPAPQSVSDYSQLNYLINDYKISYNYSATLWAENNTNKKETNRKKSANNGQILAMASNYDLAKDSSIFAMRLPAYQRLRSTLKPLPEARKEINTLEVEFDGFFALDSLSSEKIFKEKASDYAVIHLAMHGLLDNRNPIMSSLVFTEDGDSFEDNFLQAYEISKLKLNADLVVLSACETGYGRFDKGNGIASLAQAFAYAGAPAMIVTLWQVNDFATSEIMKNFYQNLANGLDKDEALQQAKLQYLKNAKGIMAHPAFWSPFIQMGNTDAIYLKKKGGIQALLDTGYRGLLAGLVVLAVGIGWFAVRRRKEK